MHIPSQPDVPVTSSSPDAAVAGSRIEDALQMLRLLRITESEKRQLGHLLLGTSSVNAPRQHDDQRFRSSSKLALPAAQVHDSVEDYVDGETEEDMSCISISTTSSLSNSPVFTALPENLACSTPVSPSISAVRAIPYTHGSTSLRFARAAPQPLSATQDNPDTAESRHAHVERAVSPTSTPSAAIISGSAPSAAPPVQPVPLSYARAAPPTFTRAPVEATLMAGHHEVVYHGVMFWVPNVGTPEPYHLVIKGTRVGIFCDWGRASEYVNGVSHNIHFRVDDWITAVDSIKSAVEEGRLRVLH